MLEPLSLEDQLYTLPNAGDDPQASLAALTALVAGLRPRNPDNAESPTRGIRALCHLLESREELRRGVRTALLAFLASRKPVSLYVDAGLFPNRGFFAETTRRLSRHILPDDADTSYLKDVVSVVFDRSSDARWVSGVAEDVWLELLRALHLEEMTDPEAGAVLVEGLLEALRVVSYRIAAIGLEPELVRIEPNLEEFESPYLAQNPEVLAYLRTYQAWWQRQTSVADDGGHLRVLLDQGLSVVDKVRTRAARDGTSLSLALLLERMRQHIERAEMIVDVLNALARERRLVDASAPLVTLLKRLVAEECRKNDLRYFLSRNVELLARRVTDNAGRAGEHYITQNRQDYFVLLRSAMLAGVVIALMALFKLFIQKAHLAPLTEGLAVCLNYALGFVFIHVLHGTVATKQPAMTAAAIAASIGEGDRKARDLGRLAGLIARTSRSQIAAIIGNVCVAVPVAVVVGAALTSAMGAPYPAPEKAHKLLTDVHPLLSGSLLFAAVAGVCLFLSGLISGYYDNLAAYNRIPQRLRVHRLARRLLGEARLNRIADYVENHLGALAGNFFFGFLLGGVSTAGVLFGLPLDIRHIAFSSAYLGYGVNALQFAVPWQEVAVAGLGVGLIGLTNLVVSFSLSLWVAFRSRQVTLVQGGALVRTVFRLFRERPREFFLPPRKTVAPAEA